MPATMKKLCPACSTRHTFFLPDAERLDPVKKYVYHCSESGALVHIRANNLDWWTKVEAKPQDAVTVLEMV